MKSRIYLLILLFLSVSGYCQVLPVTTETDTIDNDTIAMSYEMEELVISNVKDDISPELKKQLAILRRRVLKVYPYAKIASERLTILNQNMAKLKTQKEKRKYAKIVESYLENEFEGKLKKMSRKDGQILVKLIHRQTGHSTFDLIKEHKSGWKAFWSNRMAKLFSIDLKSGYSPSTVAEDFYIEGFLLQAFDERKLVRQAPAYAIDYDAIKEKWRSKQK